MIYHPSSHKTRPAGAAMLVALMFVAVSCIALAAWIHLIAARGRQADSSTDSIQRHIGWLNMGSVQQQYMLSWAMRDKTTGADGTGSTRVASAATPVAGWGGISSAAYTGLKAFRSLNRAAGGNAAYPFNNLVPLPTTNSDVYFERLSATSDSAQTQSVSMYAYLKTYPAFLLGDLLILHKRPAGVNDYYMSDNIQVNGRVVIHDEIAEAGNLRAESCLNLTKTGTNSTDNIAATAVILPQNLPTTPRVTNGGYGSALTGTGASTAVTNGTLNLVHNDNFAPGSIRNLLESLPPNKWMKITHNTTVAGNTTTTQSLRTYQLDTNSSSSSYSGSATSEIQIRHEASGSYLYGLAPSPSTQANTDYSSSPTPRLNVAVIRLPVLTRHVCIEGGVEQLVIEGTTTSTAFAAANNQPPIIICIDQTPSDTKTLRDIRFVGENNRRLILAIKGAGTTAGAEYYTDFVSNVTSGSGTSDLDWRIMWINENRRPYIDINTAGLKLRIKGGMRTDRAVNFVPAGSDARVFFDRETAPQASGQSTTDLTMSLETLLPRDGWLEPYFVAQ